MPAPFAVRRRIPERMDDPALPPADLDAALSGLARLNWFCRSAAGLMMPLVNLARQSSDRPFRILDVATGGGDLPIRIERRMRDLGIPVAIEGCDVNPVAVEYATRSAKRAGSRVGFFVQDVLNEALPTGYGAVISSLFLHHLSDSDAVTALRRMAAAGRVVLLTDLARSRFNYMQVWIACHVLTLSRVNWHDGPVSVQSAFTPVEALVLAEKAGLTDVTCSLRFPCRYLLTGRAG